MTASKCPLLRIGGWKLHVVYSISDQRQPPCQWDNVPGQLQADVVSSVGEEG